jgi:hypothetical protein
VPFRLLAQLFALRGIEFLSLQKGAAGDAAAGSPVLDTTADLRDFGDTAALIENLDLVISTDTSVAHVAGALGKSVWMLDRYNTCWRWRPSSTTSPWYPTMRIFRQKHVVDWDEVVAQVGAALSHMRRPACFPPERTPITPLLSLLICALPVRARTFFPKVREQLHRRTTAMPPWS